MMINCSLKMKGYVRTKINNDLLSLIIWGKKIIPLKKIKDCLRYGNRPFI